jgi:hypothetical protein
VPPNPPICSAVAPTVPRPLPSPAIIADLQHIYGDRNAWQIFVEILVALFVEAFATCFPPFGVIKLIFSDWK